MSDPVLVVLLSPNCGWCEFLINNWDVSIKSMLSVYPKLKFPPTTENTTKYIYPPIIVRDKTINTKIFPKDLFNYFILWTPMVMLIPQVSWNKCIKNPSLKLENVQVMNGVTNNHGIEYSQLWDIRKPESFGLWLKEALKNMNIYTENNENNEDIEPSFVSNDEDTMCNQMLNLVSYY